MLLNVKQVAEMLGFSQSWVRNKVEAEEIPFVRLGRGLRFRPEDIETWVAANAHPPKTGEK